MWYGQQQQGAGTSGGQGGSGDGGYSNPGGQMGYNGGRGAWQGGMEGAAGSTDTAQIKVEGGGEGQHYPQQPQPQHAHYGEQSR